MAVFDARPSAFTQLTTTAEWEAILSSLGCRDGIDPTAAPALTPSLDTVGRNIVIAPGQAVIKGQLWRCDSSVSTLIPAASSQDRLDRLVLRLTRGATSSATVVAPTIITGTPSGSPALPPITQTSTSVFDITVANWRATAAGALTSLVDERSYNRDQWHDMRPLINGYTYPPGEIPPQWRFDASAGIVLVVGAVATPPSGNYNGIDFFTFPVSTGGINIRPAQSTSWAIVQTGGTPATDTTGGFPRVFVASGGGCSVNGISPSLNGYTMRLNGFYPVAGFNGLLTS